MKLDIIESFADRIDRLMDERDGLDADIKEVFMDAQVNGAINVKALRKVITARRKKKLEGLRLELADTEAIADALEGRSWKPSKVAVVSARTTPKEPPPHDPETGEITEPPAEAVSAAGPAGDGIMPEIPAHLDRRIRSDLGRTLRTGESMTVGQATIKH